MLGSRVPGYCRLETEKFIMQCSTCSAILGLSVSSIMKALSIPTLQEYFLPSSRVGTVQFQIYLPSHSVRRTAASWDPDPCGSRYKCKEQPCSRAFRLHGPGAFIAFIKSRTLQRPIIALGGVFSSRQSISIFPIVACS